MPPTLKAGGSEPAPGRATIVDEEQTAPVTPVTSEQRRDSTVAWDEESVSAHSGFSRESPDFGPDVWVHVYNCDPYTGFLNKIALKHAEIGIYHAGIEVYGEEWSFQYFEDTWLDETVSGVVRCRPRQMPNYEYQESVHLGCTPLSKDEVDDILIMLYDEWPACSYHLTHRNCLLFAEHFVGLLKTPGRFPDHLRGIIDASNKNSSVDAIVDYSWSWVKWWMVRKYQQDEPSEVMPESGSHHSRSRNEASITEAGGCLWSSILSPSCAFCPGGTRRNFLETIHLNEPTSDSVVRKESGMSLQDIRYDTADASCTPRPKERSITKQ